MKIPLRALILIFLLLSARHAVAQNAVKDSAHVYTIKELQQDYYYLHTLLERTHPSLYRYTPKDSINLYFSQLAAKINHPMTELEFWVAAQSMVSKIRSGHTRLAMGIKRPGEATTPHYAFLPFGVEIKNNRLFVSTVYRRSDTAYAAGDEILDLNNEPANKLLASLRDLFSADGYNIAYKDMQMQGLAFLPAYYMLHPNSINYNILIDHKGQRRTVVLKPITPPKTQKTTRPRRTDSTRTPIPPFKVGPPNSSTEFYSYQLPEMPGTEILRIKTFTYKNDGQLHADLFAQLRKDNIKNLVIDIRNNGGGLELHAIDLLKYLVAQPYMLVYKRESIVRQDQWLRDLDVYKDTPNAASLNRLLAEINNVGVVTPGTAYKSGSHIFDGRIYLLVNEGTFSAASLFAVTLKRLGNCTVIGNETGGGLSGCDGGQLPIITLPNTGLRLTMPLYFGHSVAIGPDHGHGLIPDIVVTANPWEAGEKNDPVMAKLAEIISTDNKADGSAGHTAGSR